MKITLSDILLTAHLRSTTCTIVELGLRTGIMLPPSSLVSFHYVLSGSASLKSDNSGDTELGAGDFAMLISADRLVLRCGECREPSYFDHLTDMDDAESPHVFRFGSGDGAVILSGVFGGTRMLDHEETSARIGLLVERAQQGPAGPLFPYYPSAETFRAACTGTGARAFIGTLAYGFFIKLRRQGRTEITSGGVVLPNAAFPRITLALRLMSSSPDVSWTIGSLAREVGMSRCLFAQQFAQEVQRTPMNYLRDVRMNLAEQLLRKSGRSIAEVAWAVGYRSAAAFARAFRRSHRVTPMQFRRAIGHLERARRAPESLPTRGRQ